MQQTTRRIVELRHLGLVPWDAALAIQQSIAKNLLSAADFAPSSTTISGTLLMCQHPPVYTSGRRVAANVHEEQRLNALGAQYFKTNRGGETTFHGPGQLVVYPVLNLAHFQPSLRWYVCRLEQVLIDTIAQFGLTGTRTKDTGVWLQDRKIAAVGVASSRHIVTHGVALNCNVDLTWFKHIVPCGLVGKSVTSITHETNKDVPVEEVMPVFARVFQNIFNATLVGTEWSSS